MDDLWEQIDNVVKLYEFKRINELDDNDFIVNGDKFEIQKVQPIIDINRSFDPPILQVYNMKIGLIIQVQFLYLDTFSITALFPNDFHIQAINYMGTEEISIGMVGINQVLVALNKLEIIKWFKFENNDWDMVKSDNINNFPPIDKV